MARTVHIIGAGVSGLAAAIRLAEAGHDVHVHEATLQAGGRCRSYYDAATDLVIDNGNHLVLSGNRHVLSYAKLIGSEDGLEGPAHAEFPFVDLAANLRWTLRMNDGRIPFWIFRSGCRVPGTAAADYLGLAPLIWASAGDLIGAKIKCEGALYQRLVQPLLLAALNINPPLGSAGLAGAIVRETLLAGGQACRPLIARNGLSAALVEPAIDFLKRRGASVRLEHELHAATMSGDRISGLRFAADAIALGPDDVVIMAVPARQAAALLPGISAPTEFHSILNAHFRCVPPRSAPPVLGVVNGLAEWIFAFDNRMSVTISDADRLMTMPRKELAEAIWRDICQATGASGEAPRWQIVRERRATFAATPAQNALRPGPVTAWRNLFLAGDWTDTGLPSTIEGSIRSGDRAAGSVMAL